MGAQRHAPDGLDYVPIPGSNPHLIFGVIRSNLGGATTSAMQAVCRRLFPVAAPADPHQPWPAPSCYRHDVLLPPWAPDDYLDPQTLCRAYASHGWDGVKDLVVITSFRFPETVSSPTSPASMTLSAAWEASRSVCLELVNEWNAPVVLAFHVPSRAGQDGLPHCHAMLLARELNGPLGFGKFVRPLSTDAGRAIMDAKWDTWREANLPKPPTKPKRKK